MSIFDFLIPQIDNLFINFEKTMHARKKCMKNSTILTFFLKIIRSGNCVQIELKSISKKFKFTKYRV